jgi:probable phosphoglycerate mutase
VNFYRRSTLDVRAQHDERKGLEAAAPFGAGAANKGGDLATFLLIRHATTDEFTQSELGRSSDVHLNEEGRLQAKRLAERLSKVPISAVYSSPLGRAQQTAELLAAKHRLDVRVRDTLTELDYGEWSGLEYATLDEIPRWHVYNVYRTGTRPPGGELLVEAQTRMVAEVSRLAALHSSKHVAIVSHGDPLRALIGHFAGIPIELLHRIELAPASISTLELSSTGASITRLNDTGDLP